MCSNPCESEVTCFRPESNRGHYGLLNFLCAVLSTTELWWQINHRKSFRTLICMYILGGGMRSWTNHFFSSIYFFFRKRKDVTHCTTGSSYLPYLVLVKHNIYILLNICSDTVRFLQSGAVSFQEVLGFCLLWAFTCDKKRSPIWYLHRMNRNLYHRKLQSHPQALTRGPGSVQIYRLVVTHKQSFSVVQNDPNARNYCTRTRIVFLFWVAQWSTNFSRRIMH